MRALPDVTDPELTAPLACRFRWSPTWSRLWIVRRCLILALAIGAAAGYALAKTPTPTPTPALLAAGKAAYEGSAAGCSACHGLTGEGNGPVAFAIKPPPRNFVVDDFKGGDKVENVFTTITLGLTGTRMVGYPQLPEADRWALAYYVRAFRAPSK